MRSVACVQHNGSTRCLVHSSCFVENKHQCRLRVVVWTVGALRIEILLQIDAQLFSERFQLLQVLFILLLILHLLLYAYIGRVSLYARRGRRGRKRKPCPGWFSPTFKYSHRCWKVIDPSRSFQRGGDDAGRGDEIVGKGVVQVALSTPVRDHCILTPTAWRTCSSKTSWTASNSFSYLPLTRRQHRCYAAPTSGGRRDGDQRRLRHRPPPTARTLPKIPQTSPLRVPRHFGELWQS